MKGIKDKVISAVLTLAFMAFVRPDPNPSLVGVAFTALLMYEGIFYIIQYIEKQDVKRKKIIFMEELSKDINRWAAERFTNREAS